VCALFGSWLCPLHPGLENKLMIRNDKTSSIDDDPSAFKFYGLYFYAIEEVVGN